MPDDVNIDGSFSTSTGASHTARFRSRVSLDFHRFNYVIYEGLGSHLPSNFLSYFLGIFTGRSSNFWCIQQRANLGTLFGCDYDEILDGFKHLTSAASGRFIYLFIVTPTNITGVPDRIIEIDYTSATSWYSTVFALDGPSGDWVDSGQTQANGSHFSLTVWEIMAAKAIALPNRVMPHTVLNIFSENQVRQAGAYSATADLCRIRITTEGGDVRNAVIFDPAQIVARTVTVCNFYTRYMQIVDARIPASSLGGLTSNEQETRIRGILVCLCKQLAASSGSIANDADTTRLDQAYSRFADYLTKKANMFDNIYNFLTHPILERLEHTLLLHHEGDIAVDGYIWLEIIGPLAVISGEHELIATYFQDVSNRPIAESTWSSFFQDSLRSNTARESSTVRYWKSALRGGLQGSTLAVAIAEIRAFILVNAYTSGNMNWSNFTAAISRDTSRLVTSVSGETGSAAREATRSIRRTFRHASAISQFAALANGDISTGTFTSLLASFSEYTDQSGLKYLATRATAIRHTINVFDHATNLYDRLGVNDWDAAFGRTLCLAASITEVGYFAAYGASIGGPIGAVVGIIGAVGAVIVIYATDSEEELFMNHCSWGNNPFEDISQRDWMSIRPRLWSNSVGGMERQLDSLINLLHKYNIRHNYQNLEFNGLVSNIIAIDILTRFLPDTVKFVLKAQFTLNGTQTTRIKIFLTFPARVRPRAGMDEAGSFTRVDIRSTGRNITTGANAQVFTEGGVQRIRIHIAFEDAITSANGWEGEGWVKCYPFGHDEFSSPDSFYAFHLENLISHDNILFNHWRDYSFERSEFSPIPSW